MDRRQARREIMQRIGSIEEIRDKLDTIGVEADAAGDPILATELRRYNESLTTMLDKMYEWAGHI